MNAGIHPGDVVLINLPSHHPRGHEQEGVRPAIVVAVPRGHLRYPVVIVVPVTSQSGNWARQNPSLYQQLPRGTAGFPKTSIALIDQIRAVDVGRIQSYLGTIDARLYQKIRHSLVELFSS